MVYSCRLYEVSLQYLVLYLGVSYRSTWYSIYGVIMHYRVITPGVIMHYSLDQVLYMY